VRAILCRLAILATHRREAKGPASGMALMFNGLGTKGAPGWLLLGRFAKAAWARATAAVPNLVIAPRQCKKQRSVLHSVR